MSSPGPTPGILQEVLTTIAATGRTPRSGKAKADPRPRIELPGTTGWLDIDFVNALGKALAHTDLFLRDTLIVYLNYASHRIEPMTAIVFKTWAERHIVCFKPHTDPDTGHVTKREMSMTKEHAETALNALDFKSHLRQLAHVNTIPLPAFSTTGGIHLLQPGYDPATADYTFPSQWTPAATHP